MAVHVETEVEMWYKCQNNEAGRESSTQKFGRGSRQAGSQTSDPVNMGEEWEFSTQSPGAYRSKPSSSKPPKPTFTGVWASPGPSPTGVKVMVLMTR